MNRRMARAATIALGVSTAALWLLLDGIPWPARAFTTFLLGPLPALLILQARLLDQLPPQSEREAVYLSSALSVWIMAALAMLAARFSDFTRTDLRLSHLPAGDLILAALLTTAAAVLVLAAGKLVRSSESALVDYLIPRNSNERIAFVGLSISAGIAEELVFRSFLIAAVAEASGSTGTAVAVSVGVFAISHSYQGLLGMIRVALLGLILTVPFLLTGSVYPSMIAHATLDILAGLFLADWLRSDRD